VSFFPRYKSDPADDEYKDYCHVKIILSYPFENMKDLLEVDGWQAETFQEAYKLYYNNHTYWDDLYDELDVDNDKPEPDTDNEFEDINPS
jgi:ATP-dependent DNA helicase PIF1